MAHKIIYAGSFEYCSTWAEWPRCTWREAIRRAYAAAMEDAARYGDKVLELVSIDGKYTTGLERIDAREWYKAQNK